MIIKAITLYQPWASLAAHGLKEYETRSWQPFKNLKGQLMGIHAAWYYTAEEARYWKEFIFKYPEVKALFSDAVTGLPERPIRGMMLGVCRLVDWYPTEVVRDGLTPRERAFGNFGNRRFAWRLQVVDLFAKPVKVSGKQGIWDWDYDA